MDRNDAKDRGIRVRYYKLVINGYIVAIGTGPGGEEITEREYREIMVVVQNAPKAPEGYDYILRTDLTWELSELPEIEPENDEISDSEALDIIKGVSE